MSLKNRTGVGIDGLINELDNGLFKETAYHENNYCLTTIMRSHIDIEYNHSIIINCSYFYNTLYRCLQLSRVYSTIPRPKGPNGSDK